MKLSILIPSVPRRRKTYLQSLLDSLETQLESSNISNVEILVLYDNKKRNIGDKRNDLINLAKGEYLTFIDDDDRVNDTYINDVLVALNFGPDCVVYDCLYSSGDQTMLCKYGVEYEYNNASLGQGIDWTGKPAHTMVWKSSLAKSVSYESRGWGEDMDWVKRAYPLITNQIRIDKIMYYYDWNYSISEFVNGN
jgi:glycosyltransferase involved in cell wall biosynthesis